MASTGQFSKTDPSALVARERREEAVKLRMAGHTFAEIAAALGYADKASAYNAVKELLKESAREAGSEDLRELEAARLTALLRAHWPGAVGEGFGAVLSKLGDGSGADPDQLEKLFETLGPSTKSAQVVLGCIKGLIGLYGLNATVKVAVSGPKGGPIAMEHTARNIYDDLTPDEAAVVAEILARGQGRRLAGG